jgi:hypothetical protein
MSSSPKRLLDPEIGLAMILILHVPGALPEDIERGLAAAYEVLQASGFTAAEAAHGHWAREEWQGARSSSPRPSDEVLEAAASFRLAELSALEACCGKESAPPEGSGLRALDA